jgi:hypothetical protein
MFLTANGRRRHRALRMIETKLNAKLGVASVSNAPWQNAWGDLLSRHLNLDMF